MELPTVGVMADGIATGSMFSFLILMFYARPHPICVADGICLYFYLGMGH